MSECLSEGLKQEINRKNKLEDLKSRGYSYANNFNRQDLIQDLFKFCSEKDNAGEKSNIFSIAGRIMSRRIMGKASFAKIQDMSGIIQIYVSSSILGKSEYSDFKSWDIGDIVGVIGSVFKTKTGETSVKVISIRILTKSLKPLPDKFHGLHDQETRFRKRYLDLMVNEKSRDIFKTRSSIISSIRRFLDNRKFLEVETPMMQSIPGGANAKPFITHHNAMNTDLFLRIAPELYLKRLVVGGLEKVYEINRNFRNEGVSTKHNPEFTMLEFYEAYSNYKNLMKMIEELFLHIAQDVLGKTQIVYQNIVFNLQKPFRKESIKKLILQYCDIGEKDLEDANELTLKKYDINFVPGTISKGKIYMELFEKFVEKNLIQPTFVTGFPSEVSPLAKSNEKNPFFSDRFELYINGVEISNGFSELNDPVEQEANFRRQTKLKNSGDQEAMYFDEDYITALKYGLPPTAGAGIGIDRLVMLFTNCTSIKEVILFPTLKRKHKMVN